MKDETVMVDGEKFAIIARHLPENSYRDDKIILQRIADKLIAKYPEYAENFERRIRAIKRMKKVPTRQAR